MRQPLGTLHGHLSFPVYYEDTDSLGFVYHANYLKYFERGREHLIGLSLLRRLNEEGLLIVVRRIEMQCKAPARHGDRLDIESRLAYSRSPRMLCEQYARCGEKLLVEATIELAAIDRFGKPLRLPQELIAQLRAP